MWLIVAGGWVNFKREVSLRIMNGNFKQCPPFPAVATH